MPNRVQTLRSSTPGARPTGRLPGELYVNWPDGQLGVINALNAAQDLLAVRVFSTLANYSVGDFVLQNGQLYRSTAAQTPGAFAPANWDRVQEASDVTAAVNAGVANYLPLAGGTLTGALALNADPSVALDAATKQYVDAGDAATLASVVGSGAEFGGWVNKVRNPGMDIWQRGASLSVAAGGGAYIADGWVVGSSGATQPVSLYYTAKLAGAYSGSCMVLGVAAGLTGTYIQHRIESAVASPLAGRQCTFQCRISNSTPNPVTPNLTTYTMNSRDVASPNTADLATTTLQTIAAGWTVVVSYTFPVSANAFNGYILHLAFGGALNAASGNCAVTDVDFRVTPGLPTGLNANPPPPELRPAGVELAYCQRYYVWPPGNITLRGYNTAGNTCLAQVYLPVSMRANPTILGPTFVATSNATSGSAAMLNNRAMQLSIAAIAAGDFYATFQCTGFSAEI